MMHNKVANMRSSWAAPTPERDLYNDEYYDESQNFSPPSRDKDIMSWAEQLERVYQAEMDLRRRDVGYIIRLCESIRGGHWKCTRDLKKEIITGCRNYIVELVFDDGMRWLLKCPQPSLKWSTYTTDVATLRSEIATMYFVSTRTPIPVPRLYAWNTYCDRARNPFCKPFYIMKKMSGMTFDEKLKEADQDDYEGIDSDLGAANVVQQMAWFYMELFKFPFESNGDLDLTTQARAWQSSALREENAVSLEEVVCQKEGTHKKKLLQRLYDRMRKEKERLDKIYKNAKTPKHPLTDLRKMQQVFSRIEKLLLKVVDKNYEEGPYFLIHGDLVSSNFLVDDNWNITGVIDWELASIVPIQDACTTQYWDRDQWQDLNRAVNKGLRQGRLRQRVTSWDVDQEVHRWYRNLFVGTIIDLDRTMSLAVESGVITHLYDSCEQLATIRAVVRGVGSDSMDTVQARRYFFERIEARLNTK